MSRTLSLRLLVVVGSLAFASPAVAAPPVPTDKEIEFFETNVRPILAGTCQKCHGADKQKGGLRLDSREALLKGGESGAAVVPGRPDESPMIDAVNYRGLEMPPTGKLAPRQIVALAEWVRMGAPWPKEKPAAAGSRRADFVITDEDRTYWAFQPIGHPQPPIVRAKAWVANPIDAFLLEKLEDKRLMPNPPADPRTLVRRLFFDLIGLPPKPEEIDAFVADHSPQAYERLVDDLLSRKQYGERWGRHWLDVVRFAQTNGYERDAEKPEAWRFRDYVIASFNADKPYNQFVLEQLAGDELDEPTHESIIATGFYRLGIWDDEPDDKRVAAWDELDELVRTTGEGFLGLTMGCARCHHHMFDPIPQEDYYRFAAFFRNVEPYGIPRLPTHLKENHGGILTPLVSRDRLVEWKTHRTELSRRLEESQSQLAALEKSAADPKSLPPARQEQRKKLTERIARLKADIDSLPFPMALSVRECGPPLKETRVLIRGNVVTPGVKVEPRFPTVLGGDKVSVVPVSLSAAKPPSAGSMRSMLLELGVKPTLGLRRKLAEWIAADANPLTPRVMMNRVWQAHFGRGIVRSTDNFGRAGQPPTHPRLLAWLARDFVDHGWRIKRMHKLIVTSNAYRMSSAVQNAEAHGIDADNDLFWRQNMQRLDAEALRDSMLAVSGRLNLKMKGRGVFPRLSQDVLETQSKPGFGWGRSSPSEESRRSVYIYLKRTLPVPILELFDYANTAETLGTRPVTTVAPQALLLLNSEFSFEQATALAERLRREAGPDRPRQIDRLFRLALGRRPSARETKIAEDLLSHAPAKSVAGQSGGAPDPLRSLCLVVMNLNEFAYVD